jgi:zinc protease
MTRSHLFGPLAAALLFSIVAGAPLAALDKPLPAAPKVAAPAKSAKKAPLAAPVKVTAVEGITEYRLGNGLRVLLFPDQSKANITVNITYMVGSRHENYGETGMAHLLEHMVFKGTDKHPDVPKVLNALGARFNGSTYYDRTNYFITFPAAGDNLDRALDLEADRMVNSHVWRKDLDSEMTVVRNEFEAGENSPESVTMERTISAAFDWHNYGKSTIGARSDIENVDIAHLKAFYQTYYQPDNATLLISGKIDEAKTLEKVNQMFGHLPKPGRTLQKTYTLDPTQDGERSVSIRRVGDTQLAMALYHIPAGSHPDFAPLAVLAQVMADTPSGRLHKTLVDAKKATEIFSYPMAAKEPGFLLFGTQMGKEASLDAAKDTLLQTLEQNTAAVTAEEANRAKQQLIKGIELTLNENDRLGVRLSEFIAQGDWRLFFLHRDRIQAVTAEDVQRVRSTYLKPTNRTLGLFIPTATVDRSAIPATPDVDALVKDYKGRAAAAAGEAFEATPVNIDGRTQRFTSPAGLKVAMLAKKTRGETVSARITLRLGDLKGLSNLGAHPQLAGTMLMRGSEKLTRQQVKDAFDQLKAQVNVRGSAEALTVGITATRANLPAVLKLVTEVLRTPAFPADEFGKLIDEEVAGIDQQRSEPSFVAQTAFGQHLSQFPKGHPSHVDGPDEAIADLKAATLDGVKAFYRAFAGASAGEMAVVGDFDPAETRKLVTELLGDWKSPSPFTRIPHPYKAVAGVAKSFETPDKANAFFMAGLPLNIQDNDPAYPALLMGDYMLGGGALKSRLADRIRQKEGLSYGVGSFLQVSSLEPGGAFGAYAIYAPQNVAKLEAAFREEIAKALKDGFSDEELQTAKNSWLQAQKVSLSQDRELAGRISSQLYLGRTMAHQAALMDKVAAVTKEQVLEALRKHIDPAAISVFKAGDFAKPVEKK